MLVSFSIICLLMLLQSKLKNVQHGRLLLICCSLPFIRGFVLLRSSGQHRVPVLIRQTAVLDGICGLTRSQEDKVSHKLQAKVHHVAKIPQSAFRCIHFSYFDEKRYNDERSCQIFAPLLSSDNLQAALSAKTGFEQICQKEHCVWTSR